MGRVNHASFCTSRYCSAVALAVPSPVLSQGCLFFVWVISYEVLDITLGQVELTPPRSREDASQRTHS